MSMAKVFFRAGDRFGSFARACSHYVESMNKRR
jgi:hypothetical protein